jgi:hypothetical protein
MEVHMKGIATSLIISSLFGTSAIAADTYQIIPLYSSYRVHPPEDFYAALRVNVQTGETLYCVAWYSPTAGAKSGLCYPEKAKVGSMGLGPAALSPFNFGQAARWPAFWKVDQSSGAVTFCGRGENNIDYPSEWFCRVMNLRPEQPSSETR